MGLRSFDVICSEVIIFRPHIMGKENRNLCCDFSKFWQISTLLLHLVNSSHHGAVGSASARQTRGHGFEPVLMRYIFIGKYPGAQLACCLVRNVHGLLCV